MSVSVNGHKVNYPEAKRALEKALEDPAAFGLTEHPKSRTDFTLEELGKILNAERTTIEDRNLIDDKDLLRRVEIDKQLSPSEFIGLAAEYRRGLNQKSGEPHISPTLWEPRSLMVSVTNARGTIISVGRTYFTERGQAARILALEGETAITDCPGACERVDVDRLRESPPKQEVQNSRRDVIRLFEVCYLSTGEPLQVLELIKSERHWQAQTIRGLIDVDRLSSRSPVTLVINSRGTEIHIDDVYVNLAGQEVWVRQLRRDVDAWRAETDEGEWLHVDTLK